MEWIGTRFALTLGGIRLRVSVALEDALPEGTGALGKAPHAAREVREHDGSGRRRAYRVHPR